MAPVEDRTPQHRRRPRMARLSVTVLPQWAEYVRKRAAADGSSLSVVVEAAIKALWNEEVVRGLTEDAAAGR